MTYNQFFKLSSFDRELINSQESNIFFSLYFINKYIEKESTSKTLFKKYNHLPENIKYKISNAILNSYISHLKKALYPVLSFEYNLLKKNGFNIDSFDSFIKKYSNNPEWLKYFLEKYTILNNIIEKYTKGATEFTNLFLFHLDNDLVDLVDTFNIKIDSLIEVVPLVGDLHNGLKSVMKFVFPNKAIYYKPRNLKNEKFVDDFFSFIQGLGLSKSLIIPKLVTFDDRGWMEEVLFKEANCKANQEKFYFNQGVNLCIFRFLNTTDLIADNIIAHNEYPVYFDLECILQPSSKEINTDASFIESNQFLQSSVLQTKLLPEYSFATDKFQGISIAGLSNIKGEIPVFSIKYDNGFFNRQIISHNFIQATHQPSSCTQQIDIHNKVNTIIEGFKHAYNFVNKNKNKIIDFLINNANDLNIRFLYRPSFVYAKLLEESYLPCYLTNDENRNSLFKSLYNAHVTFLNNETVIENEYNQINDLDIPVFYCSSNEKDIYSNNKKILQNNFFSQSGIERAIIKLNDCNVKNLAQELEIIKLSFCIHEGYQLQNKDIQIGKNFDFTNFICKSDINTKGMQEKIQSQIYLILKKIEEKSINKEKETWCFWDLSQTPRSTWGISATTWGLFDGLDGYSLFFLNYFLIFNDDRILKRGLEYLNVGLKNFDKYHSYYEKNNGFNKISLINYPISTFYISEIYLSKGVEVKELKQPLIEKLLLWIEEFYLHDYDYDIFSGGAGTILYLLSLYNRSKKVDVILLANKIAKRLIESAKKYNNVAYWVSSQNKAHSGFSHGSSGIAYALAKLNHITKNDLGLNDKYSKIIEQALNFEDHLFSSDFSYWSSFMLYSEETKVDKSQNHFWAYGSGAVAQSRLLLIKYLENEKYAKELDLAIKNLQEKGFFSNYNYSSGVFGNLDIMNEYAVLKKDKDLKLKILVYLNSLFESMEKNKQWACAPIGFNSMISYYEMNGFFTGIIGIGNVLLNIYDYEKTCKLFD